MSCAESLALTELENGMVHFDSPALVQVTKDDHIRNIA